ncbi:di-trans,poly-cis-decaprenylcistransferase [Candidatus Saccharibacteria bacterium]|nr:di-trans,poly-cis-decaprenylcistransferase [Candidatus Saccharibacteria bacterium]
MTNESQEVLPRHLGLILDGNRRWAKSQGLPTLKGHQAGLENFKKISITAINSGVPYVSGFMFSTDNWNRTKTEVNYLMQLIIKFSEKHVDEIISEDIRVVFVGMREGLPNRVLKAIDSAVTRTAKGTKGVIALCINYGGQQEIVDAAKKLLRQRLDPIKLTAKDIEQALYAPELPPIDLVVRTSGEYRVSGFMLWRIAYAEFIFVDKHWPAFNKQDLKMVLTYYAGRQRRFGK